MHPLCPAKLGRKIFLVPSSFHDLFQQIQVIREFRASARGQGVAGLRTIEDFLRDRDQAGVVQGAQMRDQIAIAHLQLRFQILKGPARAGGKQGHDPEPALFVDGLVELVEVQHRSCVGFARPGPQGVNEMIKAKGDSHRDQGVASRLSIQERTGEKHAGDARN
jgi:hypothetical protein